jgi:hypothetical protein
VHRIRVGAKVPEGESESDLFTHLRTPLLCLCLSPAPAEDAHYYLNLRQRGNSAISQSAPQEIVLIILAKLGTNSGTERFLLSDCVHVLYMEMRKIPF